MDGNLGQRRHSLEEKIPDIKKTLSMVEYLKERRVRPTLSLGHYLLQRLIAATLGREKGREDR